MVHPGVEEPLLGATWHQVAGWPPSSCPSPRTSTMPLTLDMLSLWRNIILSFIPCQHCQAKSRPITWYHVISQTLGKILMICIYMDFSAYLKDWSYFSKYCQHAQCWSPSWVDTGLLNSSVGFCIITSPIIHKILYHHCHLYKTPGYC